MNAKVQRVGIAVVEFQGRFLVGIRGEDGPLAGMSEFPGGKCLEEESTDACARRECREETGLDVSPKELLLERLFDYPHGTVDLHFWRCVPCDETAVTKDHNGFRWIPAHQLAKLQFPTANQPLIEMLTTG